MRNDQLIALLPIKARSERIEGKNFLPLAGKPLYRWILDTLLSIPVIDRIIINTDSSALMHDDELSKNNRIILRDRASNLCGHHTSMNSIIADDIKSRPARTYLMTHATNPLLSADTITRALDMYKNCIDHDSLFSVNQHQTRFYKENGEAINHDPDNLIRTQDLEPWFEENSCLYIFSKESFGSTAARIGKRPTLFPTPPLESFDIDTTEQWAVVEAYASHLKSGSDL